VKLPEYRETFYTFSGKLSDIGRQLAFAGIALIWLFKKDTIAGTTIPKELFLPGAIIILGLAIDLIQYVVASIIWRFYYRYLERQHVSEEAEQDHSAWLEIPIWTLFCMKTICIMVAYCFLLKYFIGAITLR
jgi:hypothetical protein